MAELPSTHLMLGHFVDITLTSASTLIPTVERVYGVLQSYNDLGATISDDARSLRGARFFPAHRIVEISSRGRAP